MPRSLRVSGHPSFSQPQGRNLKGPKCSVPENSLLILPHLQTLPCKSELNFFVIHSFILHVCTHTRGRAVSGVHRRNSGEFPSDSVAGLENSAPITAWGGRCVIPRTRWPGHLPPLEIETVPASSTQVALSYPFPQFPRGHFKHVNPYFTSPLLF